MIEPDSASTSISLDKKTAEGCAMRFYLGEIYEWDLPTGARQAVVTRLEDNGSRGCLRFFDSNEEFTALFVELLQAGKWRRVAEIAN
jgi:hypothetical protein